MKFGRVVEYTSKKKWSFDLSGLRRLGMDEIALRKGQGDYVVVLVDLDKNELIGLVKSRSSQGYRRSAKKLGG